MIAIYFKKEIHINMSKTLEVNLKMSYLFS